MTDRMEHQNGIEILDNPGLLSAARNIGEWSFTSVMWGFWIYLFLPVINILLWVFGIRSFYGEVIANAEYLQLFYLIQKCGWIILGISLTLWFWGFYNYHRFGKRNRRSHCGPTEPEKMAEFFEVPLDRVLAIQQQKEIVWAPLYVGIKDRGN